MPRFWYQEDKDYIFGATDPGYINIGKFGMADEIILQYEKVAVTLD